MKYPGNIKKEFKQVINYGNRGLDLETIICEANASYRDNDIAYIYKKPTPLGIVKTSGSKITDAYFKSQSTLDYNGLYRSKYIEFDAKETKVKTSFPLANIHNHQLLHIKNIINHGGIAFLIICMLDKYYLFDGRKLITFIESNERKSIPIEYIVTNSIEVKYKYNIGLDYIGGLNKLMEEYNEIKN